MIFSDIQSVNLDDGAKPAVDGNFVRDGQIPFWFAPATETRKLLTGGHASMELVGDN